MNEVMRMLLDLQNLDFGDTEVPNKEEKVAALREKIPAQILGHYDRLRARDKKGLAVVRNRVCSGCHMGVTLGAVMTLRHGTDIQLCDGCGRYLYLPKEEAAAPEPVVPAKPAKSPRKRKAKPSEG
jgi:hypothetical protein